MKNIAIPIRVLRWQQCRNLSGYLMKFGKIGERMESEDGALILAALGLARGTSSEKIRNFMKTLLECTGEYSEEQLDELLAEVQEMAETEYFKEWVRRSNEECVKLYGKPDNKYPPLIDFR